MNTEISIVVADKGGITGFTVPLCAVFQDADGNKPCVWVFEQDSTVSKRPVVLNGTDSEGHAVITEGLTDKERIVRAGVNVLQQGQRVRVTEEPGKTNIGELL